MIYDCFCFFNEIDLLEIRLNVLERSVDKFVIVEADHTHTGQPKEFIFENNKDRFQKFLHKITYVKVDKLPKINQGNTEEDGNNWLLENFQRDQIMLGLKNCEDNDIVIISDLDEIPNPQIIKKYQKTGKGIWKLNQKMMYYFINNLCVTHPTWQHGTRMGKFKDLKDPKQDLPDKPHYRFSKKGLPTYFRFCLGKRIKNAGWHFSYLGGIEAIIKKRQAIAEQHLNSSTNMDPEEIKKAIIKGKDILGRNDFNYRPIFIGASFPKYIRENQKKYKNLIIKASILSEVAFLLKKLFLKTTKFFHGPKKR